MKKLLPFILILLNFYPSIGQNSQSELLKDYDYYLEQDIEVGKWNTKYFLINGLVTAKESYLKNELRSRTEFEYDKYDNVKQEKETFNINYGRVNNISEIKLEYDDTLLVNKEFDYGVTEKYSDFNKYGKPKLIERFEKSKLRPFTFKEIIGYDDKGNITKSTKFSIYEDLNGNKINEKATTHFKYDNWNNVIEIHREFEPKQKFPIVMIGGSAKYEFEYFSYKYNKNGLWIKKYKTVYGKEKLIMKRKYK